MKAGSDSVMDSPGLSFSGPGDLSAAGMKIVHRCCVISLKSVSSCPTSACMAILVLCDSKSKDGKMKMLVLRVAAKYLRKLDKFRIQSSL